MRRIIESALTVLAATAAVMLFKAVAGLWPWGGGDVHLPAGAEVCFMTQRPYLPIGTMRDALRFDDGWVDAHLMAIIVGDWLADPS